VGGVADAARERVERRLAQVRERLAADGATALLVAPGDDLRYLTGFHPHIDERLTFLVVGERGAAFVVPGVNATQAEQHFGALGITVVPYADDAGPRAALRQAFREAAGDRTGETLMVSDAARFDHVRVAETALQPARLLLAGPLFRALRLVKDADEVAALKAAAALDDEAMRAAFEAIRAGATEIEVRDAVYQAFMRGGAEEASFILVAAGPASAEPHHDPGPAVIGPGPVVVDIGCRVNGYVSDLTRMAHVGEPDAEYLRIHGIVEQARLAGEAAARIGATVAEVDAAARRVIAEAGYGPYFVHRTGHGIGVSVHEAPNVMAGDNTPIAPGLAFSIEPGIYLPGRFGVRIEDVVVITPGGPEVLSRLSREVHVVAR
jgi:Xaa-Pro dipeptidase